MRHEFSRPERFIAGTVGEPGERAFYLQVRASSRLFSVAVEKAKRETIPEEKVRSGKSMWSVTPAHSPMAGVRCLTLFTSLPINTE
jgi:hypothetical protein